MNKLLLPLMSIAISKLPFTLVNKANTLFLLLGTFLLLLSANTAMASDRVGSSGVTVITDRTYGWLPYFIEPCRDYDVPLPLALAIARQESGTQPWVINVAGKGYFPKTKKEARAIADEAWRKKQSFDVGIMQVNSFWLRKYKISVEDILEPKSNIAMGIWILAHEIKRYGLTWKAVGAYHTPLKRNPARAKAYALTVIAHMRKICDTDNELRSISKKTP